MLQRSSSHSQLRGQRDESPHVEHAAVGEGAQQSQVPLTGRQEGAQRLEEQRREDDEGWMNIDEFIKIYLKLESIVDRLNHPPEC